MNSAISVTSLPGSLEPSFDLWRCVYGGNSVRYPRTPDDATSEVERCVSRPLTHACSDARDFHPWGWGESGVAAPYRGR